jgi:hypothetical protein
MKFALGLLVGGFQMRTRVTNAREKTYRATAIMMMVVFSLMMIGPSVSLRAQQAGSDDAKDASVKGSKRGKKKKSKRSSSKADANRVILPPQIFAPSVPQQPAVTSTVPVVTNPVVQEKGKTAPLAKPGLRKPTPGVAGAVYQPVQRAVESAATVNFAVIAKQDALNAAQDSPAEIKAIHPPKERPNFGFRGLPIPESVFQDFAKIKAQPQAPPASPTGISPGPVKTFKGEFLSGTTIPPDTMGVAGTTHTVTPSNNMIRIMDRNGVELSRATMNSFWAGTTIKGGAVTSAFDTKVYFDRFNSRFIMISSLNGPVQNSGMGVAVTQTSDPTGTWNRFTAASDPASTPTAGHAIDYPSVGFNKDWIVVNENVFNFTGAGFTSYYGQQIFVVDKAAAYANTLGVMTLFEGTFATCVASATPETELGCGFTMVPAVVEDNSTATVHMLEDWDSTAAQLRTSKITGTPALPVLTVGTQFPQSTLSWRFDARRIGTTGGYLPMKQQSAYLVSGTRLMANDSRIQNVVNRGGTLWTTHTVMLSTTPQPAGTVVGGTSVGGTLATRDNHAGIQWWQIDPTLETGLSSPASVLQRARIEDPLADDCHDGNGGTMVTGLCISTATQVGEHFTFPNISVNMNNDVIIGFSKFSPFTYPNAGYVIRRSTDPVNTTRDQVIFRPGQSNYNIGAGTGGTTARQNRWGDYSAAQTDPLDDTTFWVVQEYAGANRDFGIGIAGPWETWYAQVNPAAAQPSTTGNLIISEYRLRGGQGVNDEFVELYNPGANPLIVTTADNSDGWALAQQTTAGTITGIAVIPNGTVIPSRGHVLIARNQDAANGPTLVYSLNTYPASQARGADSDVGYAVDMPDTVGVAIFKTATVANFSVATVMDAAGPATLPGGTLFREGAGFAPLPTTNLQYTMSRKQDAGPVQDTNDNVADFRFGDPAATSGGALGQSLSAPGPENLDGPINRNATIAGFLLDQFIAPSSGGSTPPNRVRDLTPDIPNNSTFGTMTVRRRVVNNTGSPVTKLRFRVVNITTLPSGAFADLRVRTSADTPGILVNDPVTCAATGTPTTAPCTVTARGTGLETPATQALGGGWNSSVNVGFITLAAPLAPGASVNVQFLLGVQQTGSFKFFVNVEALP